MDGKALIDPATHQLNKIDGYYIIERCGTEVYPEEDTDGDGKSETEEQIRVEQDFRIKDYYTPSATNNTV